MDKKLLKLAWAAKSIGLDSRNLLKLNFSLVVVHISHDFVLKDNHTIFVEVLCNFAGVLASCLIPLVFFCCENAAYDARINKYLVI